MTAAMRAGPSGGAVFGRRVGEQPIDEADHYFK
jgi:hypothetical protein